MSLFKDGLHYRKNAFAAGLQKHGYRIVPHISDPDPGDLVLVWNRSQHHAAEVRRFERAGSTLLVAENGLLGKQWREGSWFSLARDHVAIGGGAINDDGPSRWDAIGEELAPWRCGSETIILEQRGIGEPGIKSPEQWAQRCKAKIAGRIRKHPGRELKPKPLADDLVDARCVVTWCSSAGLVALLLGVPVFHEHPAWLGAQAARPLSEWGAEPKRDDAARLAVFRRAAWAMWRLREIEDGTALAHVLR